MAEVSREEFEELKKRVEALENSGTNIEIKNGGDAEKIAELALEVFTERLQEAEHLFA